MPVDILDNLPSSEDTHADFPIFIQEYHVDHIPFPATADHLQYDFVVYGEWAGVVDGDVNAGETGTMHVEQGIKIRAAASWIDPGAVFNTFGQRVWWDPTNGWFTDTEDDGLFMVGYIRDVADTAGNIGFEKRRYVLIGQGS